MRCESCSPARCSTSPTDSTTTTTNFTTFAALGDIVTSDMRHQAEVEAERARQARANSEAARRSRGRTGGGPNRTRPRAGNPYMRETAKSFRPAWRPRTCRIPPSLRCPRNPMRRSSTGMTSTSSLRKRRGSRLSQEAVRWNPVRPAEGRRRERRSRNVAWLRTTTRRRSRSARPPVAQPHRKTARRSPSHVPAHRVVPEMTTDTEDTDDGRA